MLDNLWHTKSSDDVLFDFDTPLGGLTTDEANLRKPLPLFALFRNIMTHLITC